MTKQQLQENIDKGVILCQGLYWAGECSAISFRDKTTGNRRESHVVRETILTDKAPMAVTRFLRDDEPAKDWKPSAKKNQKVIVLIQNMETERGAVTLQGSIEALE